MAIHDDDVACHVLFVYMICDKIVCDVMHACMQSQWLVESDDTVSE
jgi:hypothetical protein